MKSIPTLYAPSPESIPQMFVDAWNHKAPERLAGIFAEDAEFVNVVGLWWHNREAIWKAHEYGLRVIFPQSTLSLRQTKVKLLTPEVALVHARMKLVGQSILDSSERLGARINIFTFVLQKYPNGWLCVAAHNNDQVPGAETHVKTADGQLKPADYRN